MDPRSAAFALLACLPLVPGCNTSTCTLVGCSGGSAQLIVLGPNWGALEPVEHRLDVSLDDTSFTVSCDIAQQTCDGPVVRSGDLPLSVFIRGEGQIVIDIGDEFGSSDALPDDYAVTVTRAGTVVTDDSGSFVYTQTRPNGPDCEPVCRSTDGAFVMVEA
ncbi:MAG: hypothetical protein ACE37F_05875 [Nannocystaceae bacterium]|nr:hypothetical protein [bacterium]